MMIMKLFPICNPQLAKSLEYEPLISDVKKDEIEITEKEIIVAGKSSRFYSNPDRAFRNAVDFDKAMRECAITSKHFKDVFVEAEDDSAADVMLEKRGFQRGKTKRHCLQTKNVLSDYWTEKTILKYAGKCYYNILKALTVVHSYDDDETRFAEGLKSIHTLADSISIYDSDAKSQIKFFKNRKYHHPLTMISPCKAIYRCTDKTDTHFMMRPFPTLEDINSMIEYVNTKGDRLFT